MVAAPSEPARGTRRVLAALALVVTGLFTWLAIRSANVDEVAAALQDNEWAWIVPAVLVLAVAVVVRGARWWTLFVPDGRPPLPEVVRATVVGLFFNSILPLRAGEAARVVALRRRTTVSGSEILGTVATERLYDVGALLVLLFALLPVLPDVSWAATAAWFALALALGVAVAVGFLARYGERGLRVLLWPLRWLPAVTAERWERSTTNLLRGFAGLRWGRLAVEAFLLTVLSWLVVGVSFWILMLGFDLDLAPWAGVLVIIAVGLALVLPSGPAGVGVFEAAVVIALAAYGVDASTALSYALVAHVVNFLPYVVAGLVLLPGYRR